MTSRERVRTVLEGGIPDRVPIHDGYWDEALWRWQREGLPGDVASDRHALGEFFDTEIRTISADSSFIRDKTSTPGLISFPVGSRQEWEGLKGRLASVEGRLPGDLEAKYRAFRASQRFVVVCVHDPYEASWSKLGPTFLLETMKVDPDFARDVFTTITDLNLAVCEHLFGLGYEPDAAWIWGDIAYSRGTFFSPEMYREMLYPLHRRLIRFFTGRGLPVIYHSDGDIRNVIPLLVDAGVRCLQPLEAKANMDLFDLKRAYGDRLAFMGNVDFDRIALGPDQAEEEIRIKVGMGKRGGGYIYHSDHSVPPTVSLETYRRVLALVKAYGTY
jgi:uroporphyrinogen decarboxylase